MLVYVLYEDERCAGDGEVTLYFMYDCMYTPEKGIVPLLHWVVNLQTSRGICDMVWSMKAKVGKCEAEIQAKIGSKNKKYIRK